jgi:hypothetical protein
VDDHKCGYYITHNIGKKVLLMPIESLLRGKKEKKIKNSTVVTWQL